ncbi:hypothetical protein E0485_24330 [Paenibacillus albiflavus]|uniref:DUF898 family protein n=1 Tax=Paenibacillus albiflavus TaxID=2545760 RepID=A0A4R4DWD7_9BACL|nr:hypothetical protein [Paenibacillus albiflavus]TCZ68559.1 hypothetical protein E0485_24330 [Paenibacillus albiflavus]
MMEDKIFKFGRIPANTLLTILFYTGILPIMYQAFVFGRKVYLNNFIQTQVKEGNWYIGKEINNLPLGVLQGVIVFIISIIIWKVICELILIVVRYFEIKNSEIS